MFRDDVITIVLITKYALYDIVRDTSHNGYSLCLSVCPLHTLCSIATCISL